MILRASTPDALAAQGLNYDQLIEQANRANANAITEGNARAIANALAQRSYDQNAQQFDVGLSERAKNIADERAFNAAQNELNRKAYLAQNAENKTALADEHQDQILKELLNLDSQGRIDDNGLKSYKALLSPERYARALAVHDATKSALATQTATANAPQNEAAASGAAQAEAANRYTRILQDQAGIAAHPTEAQHRWWNPFKLTQGIPEQNVIQPSEHAANLMAASGLPAIIASAGKKDSLIVPGPTGFESAFKPVSPIVVANAAPAAPPIAAPPSISPARAAAAIAEANRVIGLGADPVKVKARLKDMGVMVN